MEPAVVRRHRGGAFGGQQSGADAQARLPVAFPRGDLTAPAGETASAGAADPPPGPRPHHLGGERDEVLTALVIDGVVVPPQEGADDRTDGTRVVAEPI